MKKHFYYFLALTCFFLACTPSDKPSTLETSDKETDEFVWQTESFADKKMIRYQIPGFEKLTLDQKKLVYYLTQAGLAGRDITYDQNYKHNLAIRKALDKIMMDYKGDKSSADWKGLEKYAKEVWFASGIHHHYGNEKFTPEFSQDYFETILSETGAALSDVAKRAMFDPSVDPMRIDQSDPEKLLENSAVNFYADNVGTAEAKAFYAKKNEDAGLYAPLFGLNSQLVKDESGQLQERVWKVDGMYGEAIQEIIKWLELATTVAENEPQKKALELLIEYYKTGDLKTFDLYSIAWTQATEGDIDYINSFIEVYHDPLGYKGSYESIVEINDFEASERMAVVADNAAYFESNSPIMDEHKKKEVVGISYKVVNVAGESGDASPSTPIGVNLPNSNWIRARHGSKSVSLGNIVEGYSNADGPGLLQEFAHDDEEIARAKKHGKLGAKMHTALHEVIGHASGQLEPGVENPAQALQNFASPLEEARADLVALYYIMDQKLVDMGLMESLDVGKAEYDSYLKNGMMTQLRRIQPGKTIEQAHMRNRAMVAHWAFEKGSAAGAVEMVKREGKSYIDIKDYDKMRELFGELLREVQRIKSQGDYAAAKAIFEDYGIQVDPAIHQEVLDRSAKLNIPPYGGFINPKLVPVEENGEITDIQVEYPDDFTEQMLDYAENFGFLPAVN
ncbi:MAG: dihydrofolate reductase [Bacteroidota bacterium]